MFHNFFYFFNFSEKFFRDQVCDKKLTKIFYISFISHAFARATTMVNIKTTPCHMNCGSLAYSFFILLKKICST